MDGGGVQRCHSAPSDATMRPAMQPCAQQCNRVPSNATVPPAMQECAQQCHRVNSKAWQDRAAGRPLSQHKVGILSHARCTRPRAFSTLRMDAAHKRMGVWVQRINA
eukprot:365004-Chlamydomonas_euryale.AAC.12